MILALAHGQGIRVATVNQVPGSVWSCSCNIRFSRWLGFIEQQIHKDSLQSQMSLALPVKPLAMHSKCQVFLIRLENKSRQALSTTGKLNVVAVDCSVSGLDA